jgi:hypothetical protein
VHWPSPQPPPAHEPQPKDSTSSTHTWSHAYWQQKESWPQTHAWIVASSHPGVCLGLQQLPPPPQGPQSSGQVWQLSPGSQTVSPHVGPDAQDPQPNEETSPAQIESHAVWQQ